MKEMLKKISKRKEFLTKLLARIDAKYINLPEGNIYIAHKKGKPQYYFRKNEKDPGQHAKCHYIKRSETKLIHDLIQKKYIDKLRGSIVAELKAIDSFLEKMPDTLAEDVYGGLKEERREFVDPEVENDELFALRWSKEPFLASKIDFDSDSLKTDRGETVRSKSEYIIANILNKHSIPYKYEKALRLRNGVVYPDFTILDVKNRREIYLEHLGMLGEPYYLSRAIKKVNEYNRSGYCLGNRLLVTMESSEDTIDVEAVERMILNFLKQ